MHSNPLRKNLKPHLWFQLYWVVYLIWFFWLDLTVKNPKYIIHAPLDDLIPFCEWFVFPYCSWFFLLAGVTALLWWYDTASYDKLCLMMFSGMTFCLLLYMVLPNGLDIRPTAEAIGRDNIAMRIMQMLWNADASVNVCPSIHCQSSGCMALAFSRSKLAQDRPGLKVLAWGWALPQPDRQDRARIRARVRQTIFFMGFVPFYKQNVRPFRKKGARISGYLVHSGSGRAVSRIPGCI